VKIEPGQFDLGDHKLQLKSYVDVEGSGEAATILVGTVDDNASTGRTFTVSARSSASASSTTIERSTVSGLSTAIAYATQSPGGESTLIEVGASQLGGGAIRDLGDGGATTFRCVASYDDDFAPLAANCRAAAQAQPPRARAVADLVAPLVAAEAAAAARHGITLR
jgi:hypothetical protein